MRIKTGTLLKNAAVFYLVPVLGLRAGALSGPAIGKIFSLNETVSAIISGFAIGFVLVLLYSNKKSSRNRLLPIIEKIIMPPRGSG